MHSNPKWHAASSENVSWVVADREAPAKKSGPKTDLALVIVNGAHPVKPGNTQKKTTHSRAGIP